MDDDSGTIPSTSTSTLPVHRLAEADWPTGKSRLGAQHAVTRLLDALAPERPPAKREAPITAIQRLRYPHGCILQSALGAVTVSWFPAVGVALGELQVITWRGTVSRPGSAQRATVGAEAVWREVLVPVQASDAQWQWRADDGAVYGGTALVERCQAMLGDTPADAVLPTIG